MCSHLLPLITVTHSTQRHEILEALGQAAQRHNCPPTLPSWGTTCLKTLQFVPNKPFFLLLRMLCLPSEMASLLKKHLTSEIHSRNDLQRLTRKVGFSF